MNKAVYFFEIKRRMPSTMIWAVSLLALLLVFMALFPSFSADMKAMNQVLDNFPPEFKAIFGLEALNLASVEGYFGFCLVFCQLCLAIQAANYGFGLVSTEETELTADFLLTKPLKRSTILGSKLLAALTNLLITDLIFWAASFASIELFRNGKAYDQQVLLLLLGSVLVFQLIFFSLGLLISLFARKIRSVTPWGLGLAFGTYVLSAFSGMFEDVKLEYLSPFKHFDPGQIINTVSLDNTILLIDIAISVLAILLSYWLYQRRDISSPA